MMKKLITFIGIICLSITAQGTHIAGAEIWYEHDTLNDYIVHLKIYRDCGPGTAGIGSIQNVTVSSASLALNIPMTVDTAGSNIAVNGAIVNTCMPNSCINPTSNLHGLEMWHYTGSITLPNTASDWTFTYSTCCRNGNGTVSSATGTLVSTTLNNVVTPFNNGLSIPYDLPYYFSLNNSQSISLAAYETDGDSLDYQLTTARQSSGPCPYLNGNTPLSPFPNSSITLDNQTGLFTFTPTQVGNYVIAVETREYRNGVLIGSSTRDHQITVISGSANTLPNLSGINGTNTFIETINVCGASVMNFTINTSDPDPGNTTTITNVMMPNGAAFTSNTAANQVGTFTWTPTLADVQAQPYILVVEVQDNNCGTRQEVYQLYVNHCNTDSVWAGDANADFTCDNYDILNIGIANAQSGPVRVGATTNWQAEWCANWPNNFISNINQKHADCNGDGTVNAADLASVTANYGLVHQKTGNIGQYKTLGLPDLYCDMTNVQAHKGSTVTIPIMLGTTGSLMNDFYGIAAKVELLNSQTSAPISVSKNTSWIGNSSNSFSFEKSLAQNKVAFTFVRSDQQNVTAQQGQIGEITFPIDMASVVGSEVTVQFSDIKIIKNNGEEITDYNVLQDKLTVLAPVSTNDIVKGFSANVYPNPTQSNMTISLEVDKTQDYKITLYDMVGRLVKDDIYNGELANGKHSLELDLSSQASGQYQLEISSESGKVVLPVLKQ